MYEYITCAEVYRRFNEGETVAELAKARGCSVPRIYGIINKERRDLEYKAMYNNLYALSDFDKRLAKLDPAGNSAITMAYLQPLRKFLEQISEQ